jgi:D-cysteine desulfhydrase
MPAYNNLKFPPCLGFTRRETPLQLLNSFKNEFPGYDLWLKRDDLTGSELSGNKVRKLDFLVREAVEMEATHLITCGGVQSNHCRATAYMAAKNDLKSVLFLRGEAPEIVTGNLLLDQLAGAEINFITPAEYKDVNNIMAERAELLPRAYIIPEGGSNATGAWGYVACFREIINQLPLYALQPDTIWVATGSGGTHAGLLIGKHLFDSHIDIVSVNVCDDAPFFKRKIQKIIDEFQQVNSCQLPITEDDIHIVDGFVGEGYAKISQVEIKLIKKMAQNEGVIMDPVYTAKAFIGLCDHLKSSSFDYKNILFIHTGGVFSVFAHAAALQNP